MNRLWEFMKNLLLAAIALLAAYRKGKNYADLKNTQTENARLKAALKSALDGDYSYDAVRERMRDSQPED